ncbi:SusC/RagA family TonB-linked outer membrane protein [uncultured Polaribacter sp.]|uniref:SusC/RagA family TonB-linked outer membrane protein n=1 Tax=uncultured Polaribacter sp. TaxID=174711 RepID=UPI002622B25A|nr:SusC/RagA family TonB-linked outer membrane protein [uncultured Polaribacter sp.]
MEIKLIKSRSLFQKWLLMIFMRTFIFLLCTTVFSFNVENSFSQKQVKIKTNQVVSVDAVFRIIQKQTKYRFLYPEHLFKHLPDVPLKKGSISVDKLLHKSIGGGHFNIILSLDHTILIKDKKNQRQQQVTGTVTNDKGEVLPSVTILIKGTNRGLSTNFDGQYQITVPDAASVLVFSYLGYATQEILVGNQTTINVALKETIGQLDEVTINAGYYKTTQREATGSIAKVEAKTIENQPVQNPLAALPGRIPGVQITQQGGVPGAGFTVRIRGQNSISSGNEPFYVVDGVPFDSQTMSDGLVSTILPRANLSPFNLINPSDIESIEILKDADATAIYGSRGANGVVLITTKKGKEGKTTFNINVDTGMGSVSQTRDLLNTEQFLEMRREALVNDGLDPVPSFFEPAFPDVFAWDQNRYTDWQEVLLGGTAYTNNVQASVSGGNSNTQFLLSGGYYTETTVFPGDFKYKRGTIRANINHSSTDERFKLVFSTNYTTENNDLPANDLTPASEILAPNAPALFDDEGNLNFENGTFNNNPLAALNSEYESERSNLFVNSVLSYQIIPSLELKTSLGFSDTDLNDYSTSPSTRFNPAFGVGPERSSLFTNNGKRKSWIIEPQINWQHSISKGTLRLSTGTTFQEQTDEQLTQFGDGFTSNNLILNISSASVRTITNDTKTEYKYQAVYGRINYNWDGKYIINLTGRRDGSSRFGPDKQFANFGAIGAAWIFSNENFLKDQAFLSYGKLRGSYGTSGNDQIGDYQFLDTYSGNIGSYDGTEGLQPTRLFNPDFAWEVNEKLELALELGLLNDRITFTGAYFRNISSNQLVGTPLPGTTGFNSIQSNLGATVKNTGLELELQAVNFQKENFQWTTSFNMTVPRNELVSFPGLEGSTFANQFVVGESLSILKLYHNLGVNPETGIYEFEDYNDDGIISNPEDLQWLEDTAPIYFGGLNNNITYKNWDLDIFFQFTKQKARNFLISGAIAGTFGNQPVEVLDRWQQPGDQATFQRYTVGLNGAAVLAASRLGNSNTAVTDASFVRLKNVSLSYTIPASVLKGKQCRLYVQGQNLFTFTNFKGSDPERSVGFIPILRRLNIGISFNF